MPLERNMIQILPLAQTPCRRPVPPPYPNPTLVLPQTLGLTPSRLGHLL